ncbi:MAG: response regulator [Deltaproteobacteria bacterium]|nr:response regulator [Deltaproteobacteria bacterium]
MPRTMMPQAHGTVIVVDDVEAMRDVILAYLRKWDAQLTLVSASNAQQALAMVESYGSLGPDPNERVVVISDLRMPGLDGMTLLRSLAGSPFEVRTILMTAFPDDGVHDRAMELGALACFAKPFELDALAEVVWRAVHDAHAANEAPPNGTT